MEDPNSRPAAAKLIDDVIRDYNERQGFEAKTIRYGWSLAMRIWDKLGRAGMLRGPDDCPCPFDCTLCHNGDGVCDD